jgi:hemerythrin-like metal-binding protein
MSGLRGLTGVSLSNLISWSEDLKVEHPQIDAQHEAIFAMISEVSDIWQGHGSAEKLLALVDKLGRVLKAHFQYEETVLADIRYPKLPEHRAEHNLMLRELASIRRRIDHMGPGQAQPEPGWLVMNFMFGVTIGHIVHSDSEYVRYAREAAEEDRNSWPHS